MASIQHYVCDADIFPLQIIKKHAALQDVEKQRHFAALKIQRLWRGYVVRKEIARWHRAAKVLQKYIRRWLVLWHLPDIYREYLDWYRQQFYNRMATKIQALWRGYWVQLPVILVVRRDRVPIKELLARRLAIEKANEDVRRQMQEAFRDMKKIKMEQMNNEAHDWVLLIVFKLHHLIRTKVREGIYSDHGSTKYSEIEELLNKVAMEVYMTARHQEYYEEIKHEKPPPQYLFKSERLHRIEDIYRNRDRSRETKSVFVPDRNIHSKPFKLTPKIEEEQYSRKLLYSEKYSSKKYEMVRAVEWKKHMSDTDFDLHVLKKMLFDLKPPPYYLDFWDRICEIHNIPDI